MHRMSINKTTLRRSFFAPALVASAALLLAAPTSHAEFLSGTFEDQNPGTNTFRNDFRPTNHFNTGGFTLNNNYNATYGSWSGFAVSSRLDNTFGGADYNHQYGAYAPAHAGLTGSGGSATYAVAYNGATGDALINLPTGADPSSIDITNTTYAAQSITLGDGFARAFQPGDFFRLDILGFSDLNGNGNAIGSVSFFLADYRGSALQLVSDWTTVDLSSLAGSQSLAFSLTSTDVGDFGMNTPATFAIDNLVAFRANSPTPAVPEPSTVLLLGLGLAGLLVQCHRLR